MGSMSRGTEEGISRLSEPTKKLIEDRHCESNYLEFPVYCHPPPAPVPKTVPGTLEASTLSYVNE